MTVPDTNIKPQTYAELSGNSQERVYKHPDGTIFLSFEPEPLDDKVAEARFADFLLKANTAKKAIDATVLNSPGMFCHDGEVGMVPAWRGHADTGLATENAIYLDMGSESATEVAPQKGLMQTLIAR